MKCLLVVQNRDVDVKKEIKYPSLDIGKQYVWYKNSRKKINVCTINKHANAYMRDFIAFLFMVGRQWL